MVMEYPQLRWVSPLVLVPNTWNPNQMTDEMYRKAIASIRAFGFVDPVTVRYRDEGTFEIIDGEHRWRAAEDEHLDLVPIFDLGHIQDDDARQLTIVLNETRGQVDPRKLGDLLRDLRTRTSTEQLLATLPYSREALDRLSGMSTIDWSDVPSLGKRDAKPAAWVERTYRMPKESAEVLDRAIERAREDDERMPEWRVLELLASEYLNS